MLFPVGLTQSPKAVAEAVACTRKQASRWGVPIPEGLEPEVKEIPPHPMLEAAPPHLHVGFIWEE